MEEIYTEKKRKGDTSIILKCLDNVKWDKILMLWKGYNINLDMARLYVLDTYKEYKAAIRI